MTALGEAILMYTICIRLKSLVSCFTMSMHGSVVSLDRLFRGERVPSLRAPLGRVLCLTALKHGVSCFRFAPNLVYHVS